MTPVGNFRFTVTENLTGDVVKGNQPGMKHPKTVLALGIAALVLASTGCAYTSRIKRMSTSELKIEYLHQARVAGMISKGGGWSFSMGGAYDAKADAQRRVNCLEVEMLHRRERGDKDAEPPELK